MLEVGGYEDEIGLCTGGPDASQKHLMINQRGGHKNSPLEAASYTGQLDAVKLLLGHGADPNADSQSASSTALSAAAKNGHIDIVTLLLNEGADIHEGLSVGSGQQLRDTSQPDRYTIFHEYVDPPSDQYDQQALRKTQKTALWEAAFSGQSSIVKLLLEHGANLDMRNGQDGSTALHQAVLARDTASMDLLLAAGAIVDKTDLQARTPLGTACREWMPLFTEDVERKLCAIEIVERLLKANADASKFHPQQGSYLRTAAVTGHLSIIRPLIQYGADVNRWSPLSEALRHGHTEIAKMLIENGANVNQIDILPNTIPLWLLRQPVTSCIADILRATYGYSNLDFYFFQSLDNEHKCLWAETPLWIAAAQGDIESVKALLENGADPLFRNRMVNMTPLEIAFFEGHANVLTALLAAVKQQRAGLSYSQSSDEIKDGTADDSPHSQRASEVGTSRDISMSDLKASFEGQIRRSADEDSYSRNSVASNDSSQVQNNSTQIPILQPSVMKMVDKELRLYSIAEALRQAKKEPRVPKKGSLRWAYRFSLKVFLTFPDLRGIGILWDPDETLTDEDVERGGRFPLYAGPPKTDLKGLPYRVLKTLDSESESEHEEETEL